MKPREAAVRFESDGLPLEGRWRLPADEYGAVVVCHPHPQFGGTMDNNVVVALSDALAAHGLGTLRFNFRGVGLSRGAFDFLKGEIADVKAALEFVRQQPGIPAERVGLAGYSFGGLAALYAAMDESRLAALALVSPMIPEKGFARDPRIKSPASKGCAVFACTGSEDGFCPPSALAELGRLTAGEIRVFAGTDHFWAGRDDEAAEAAAEFLAGALAG